MSSNYKHHEKEHQNHSHQHSNEQQDQHSHHEHNHQGGHQQHHANMIADFRRRFWVSLLLTLPVLALSPMIMGFMGLGDVLSFSGDLYVNYAFSTLIFFYGGWPFLKGLFDELKQGNPGMMTLIALAISVAYFYSSAVVLGVSGKIFYWELATLIDIMLLGHWIEMKSVMGASRALEELAKLLPDTAHKLDENDNVSDVAIDELQSGDRVLIKPGEKIPVDGEITKGDTSINEAMISGESKPVSKTQEDKVIGGSINGDGSITVRVEKTGKDSYLSQLVDLVNQAQQTKSKTQDLANRAARWLTFAALGSGAVTMAAWLLAGKEFVFALERTVTVMVITCPHALGLAVPLVVAVSTAISAKNGLLIRNRAAFETARRLDAVIFDKTGTLTTGEFGVSETIVFNGKINASELLNLAAAVEQQSEHPIAHAIADAAKNPHKVSDFKAIPGKGARGQVNGSTISVVSPGYLQENGIDVPDNKSKEIESGGATLAYVLQDDHPLGVIALADQVRPESKQAIARLKELGIRTIMLTGDNQQVAESVAKELELDEYFAQVLPEKKVEKVKEVQSRNMTVAMTGDGVNDAPALAQADVGIAIGAGTDVAIEAADIVLVRSNPEDVVDVISLAGATHRKMVQNLAWATGYNVVAIPLAAGVLFSWGIMLSPAVGAVLMSLSTVIVAINARIIKTPGN